MLVLTVGYPSVQASIFPTFVSFINQQHIDRVLVEECGLYLGSLTRELPGSGPLWQLFLQVSVLQGKDMILRRQGKSNEVNAFTYGSISQLAV